MKVKTNELSGVALSYTVCMIEMPHLVWGETIGEHYASKQIVVPEMPDCYGPYTDWDMCGPIIEREKISVLAPITRRIAQERHAFTVDYWRALSQRDENEVAIHGRGPTLLIAAMRCYVASKLGEEVDIPEELCK